MEKKTSINSNKFLALICLFNSIILFFYVLNFDLPKSSILFKFLIFFLFFSLISFLIVLFKLNILKKILNIQISLFFLIVTFLVIEIFFVIIPSSIPKSLSLWISKNNNQQKVIDYLDKSPFIKFKPDINVRSAYYRGFSDQFVYSWKTDKYGFKNLKQNVDKKKYKALLLGNSWSEGMGVKTDDTFASKLSNKDFLTYNLGVQGYSPSQQYGVLNIYGSKLDSDYIITVYVAETYLREKKFYNKTKPREFTGGIANIDKLEKNEIRNRAKYVSSAIWLTTTGLRNDFLRFIKYFNKREISPPFKRYQSEFFLLEEKVTQNLYESLYKDVYWAETLRNFQKINSYSKKNKRKMIFVYAPRRANVYYEIATKKKLPNTAFLEVNLFKEFCKKENIIFLDLTSALIEFTSKQKDINKLPFLKIDGHLSSYGHEIFANEILAKIKDLEK